MSCPPRVRSALASVDGVEDVKLDYEAKTVTVSYGNDSSPDAMIAALDKAGFGATVVN
ncbi:MAG: heavy metal-associated domain-containing protein [Planctomycetota bacterium]